MYSMSKKQISQYLLDYSHLCNLLMQNPNVPAIKLFSSFMIQEHRYNDNNYDYYQRMIRTFTSYTYFKKFSILEDFLLNRDDFLNNDDLEGLKDNVINLECPNGISNKKIVQLIRNGFNHNDSPDFDRFRMSISARNYEVEFKDLRTNKEKETNSPVKHFLIKFNDKYISELNHLISQKAKNVLVISYDIPRDFNYNSSSLKNELSKIKINRFYFTKKLDDDVLNEIKSFSEREKNTIEELDLVSSAFKNYVSSACDINEIYTLDNDQIDTLYSMIDFLRKGNEEYLKYGGNSALYYLINKVIPVPGFKKYESDNQLVLASFLMSEEITFREILSYIDGALNNDNKKFNNEHEEFIFDYLKKYMDRAKILDLYVDCLNGRFVQNIPLITFIDSVICNLCNDEAINIKGINYDKESIRNSFAHRRWYIDQNNRIVLYDADPKNINDNNLELVGKISIADLANWSLTYFNNYDKTNHLTR